MSQVLIVDDSADSRSFCELIARICELEVSEAGSVDEALRAIDAGLKPRVILLDLVMPGQAPEVLVERVKRDRDLADTKVILMSALKEAPARAQLMGADEALAKPLDLTRFVHRLKIHTQEAAIEAPAS
jgi:CheY-like chemotaxis protein